MQAEDAGVALDFSGAILNNMTWSYSKLLCYQSCPYQFYLRYILHNKQMPLFYASYGKFVHELLAGFYSGQYSKDELVPRYISGFFASVDGKSPGLKIFGDYYTQGLEAMQNPWIPDAEIIGTETKVVYDICGHQFTGFIDMTLLSENGDITIVDHKSHNLKQRSTRKKPTLKDKELDSYFKQLYLYSASIQQTMGVLPKYLVFNCYRSGEQIVEEFNQQDYQNAIDWASSTINKIFKMEWPATGTFYQCKQICDVAQDCEWRGV